MRPPRPVERLAVGLATPAGEVPIGTLAWSLHRRQAFFEFTPAFLAARLRISPLTLETRDGALPADAKLFQGLHGVFDDSLPDRWGRLLVDRRVRAAGADPSRLSPLDRLAMVGKSGMGALTYVPMEPRSGGVPGFDVDRLADDAVAVLKGGEAVDIAALVDANGGSAGARPKAMVLRDRTDGAMRLDVGQGTRECEDAWLVKFRSQREPETAGRVEHAYASMARAAGVDFPETHLLVGASGIGYFAVRRFDRPSAGRLHVHTLSRMVGADHRMPSLEYEHLLRAARIVTGEGGEVEEAFRRMTFNVLASNRDDHSKNHAFAMDWQGNWRLTPAYGVTLSDGPAGEQAMAVAGEGRDPGRKEIGAVAALASIPKRAVSAVWEQVTQAVRSWAVFADEAGVPGPEARRIGMMLVAKTGTAKARAEKAVTAKGDRGTEGSGR